jgi:hypothetical protein
MVMINIEDKIRNNREQFDAADPSERHLEKFQLKVQEFTAPRNRSFNRRAILKVAAVLLVLIASTVVFFTLNNSTNTQGFSNSNAAEVPEELQEVQYYYTSLTNEKLEQINEFAENSAEAKKVQEMALHEVDELGTNAILLEQEYENSGKNERLFNAIINNYRIMTDLLDHILEEMDQNDNQESSNIYKSKENEKVVA